MLDEVIANGAEPYFTMFHWDLPQACQDQFGGFGDERIIEAFVEYAKVLLENFGDKVTYWLTINEPEANCKFGWEMGLIGRFNCFKYARQNYPKPWMKFGVPSIVSWYQAGGTQSPADLAAADFVQQRDLSWFFDPTVFGDWGDAAKSDPNEGSFVQNAAFSAAEQDIIRNTTDFIALNYYSTSGIKSNGVAGGYEGDTPPISYSSGSWWQNVYAPGLRLLANYVHKRYNIDIHITEIGYAGIDEQLMTVEQSVNNPERLRFWREHLTELQAAILRISFLFWIQYNSKFGAIHVDFASPNLTRTVKNSTYYIAVPARQAISSTTNAVATASATITSGGTVSSTLPVPGAVSTKTSGSIGRVGGWVAIWIGVLGMMFA
ncbi:glycoside hydrolase superfamily [Chytridium lagenaria]|nr:glycoside hydrolase superfamily [Chytridium lagenaria]